MARSLLLLSAAAILATSTCLELPALRAFKTDHTIETGDGGSRGLQSSTVDALCLNKEPGTYCVSSDEERAWKLERLANGGTVSACSDSYYRCNARGRLVTGGVERTIGRVSCLYSLSAGERAVGHFVASSHESCVAATPSVTPSASETATSTASATSTSTGTGTASETATSTASPTSTSTGTGTASETATRTASPTSSLTSTGTSTSTGTPTSSSTGTGTGTATSTASPTSSSTPTNTATSTGTPTSSSTGTSSASETATNSASGTPTSTATPTSSATSSASATSTSSGTSSASVTPTASSTQSGSETPTASAIPSSSETGTASSSSSSIPSPTPSSTAAVTSSRTRSVTPTASRNPTTSRSASPSRSPSPTKVGCYTGASGVQNNLLKANVQCGGWRQCYESYYGQGFNGEAVDTIASVQAACNGANIMVACYSMSAPTVLKVAASAPRADVFFDTGVNTNTVHVANGVNWYFNSEWSMGFSPAGTTVNKNSCDVTSTNANQRLCIHAWDASIQFGYRCGDAVDINGGTDASGAGYYRVFYTK